MVEDHDKVLDLVIQLALLLKSLLKMNPLESAIAGLKVVEAIAKLFIRTPSLWEQIERNVRKEVKTAITNYHEANLLGILTFFHEQLENFIIRASVHMSSQIGRKTPDLVWRKDFVNDVYNHYTLSVRANAHLFKPSNFEGVIIYDVSLFHIYFSFISHELVVLKLLESQCAGFNGTETIDKYRVSYYTEKIEAVKKDLLKSALPDSKSTAKNLFWGDLNYDCSSKSYISFSCKDAWSGEMATYYWDVRWPLVDGTSPRTWNLYFADKEFAADGTIKSCSGSAFFDYANGSFFNPGAYDECGKVTWTSGGECRKISAHPAKYDPAGTVCGVNPRRIYLNAARDLWHNFTAPTLLMIGEPVPIGVKNVTFDGKSCLHWASMEEQTTKMNWTGLTKNFCSNPDDWVNGPWCYISKTTRKECYDTNLPMKMFPEGCLSPKRKYGQSYEWCIEERSRNYPYGGSWKAVNNGMSRQSSKLSVIFIFCLYAVFHE